MAITTYPFDSGPGSAITEDQWRPMARNWGPPGNDMVIKSPPTYNELAVSQHAAGANLSVDVASGQAWVDGYFLQSTAVVNVPIAANSSGNPRIDTIVVNIDMVTKLGTITVVQGTPAATPSAPALTQTQGVTWQFALANIAVANGASSIVTANITDGRVFSNTLRNYVKRAYKVTAPGAAVTWDVAAYPVLWLSGMTANCTVTLSNVPVPAAGNPVEVVGTIYGDQDGTGSRTLTIATTGGFTIRPAGGAMPAPSGASKRDIYVLTTLDGVIIGVLDGGRNI